MKDLTINGSLKIRNLQAADYPAAKEIITQSFDDHLGANPGVLDAYEQEPWYDPEHLLVAEVDGQVVSQMGVRDGTLWIEGKSFPAGLVGTVCTLPEFRGKGIGAEMMKAAFSWMNRRGLALSYLHTSEARHGFYGRLGYRLSSYFQARTLLESGPQAGGVDDARIRKSTPSDAALLNTLYEAHYGALSGAWSRTEVFWRRRLEGKPKLWFTGTPEFWILEDKVPLAYLGIVPGSPTRIIEFACPTLDLSSAKRLFNCVVHRFGDAEIQVWVAERDPLSEALSDHKLTQRSSFGNVFIRVQEESAFLKLAGELLSARAEKFGVGFEIRIKDTGSVLAGGNLGDRVVLSIPLNDLGALVYSGGRIQKQLEKGIIECISGKEKDLMNLFPETYPSRCPMDGY